MQDKNVNVAPPKEEYDAIVVGSGMTGGWAAKELCEKGLKTLVLERGRDQKHGDYPTEHKRSWEFDYRNRGVPREAAYAEHNVQRRTYAFRESTKHYFVNDRQNPYRHPEGKPFTWIRGDQVGGRSLTWGRHVYRWSDLDFAANAADGHGVDWPVRYNDLAPWYSYVEKVVGVSGETLGLPQLPDGAFQKPMAMNAAEKHVKKRIEEQFPERTLTPGRVAILTEPLNGRAPCHYCGPCERGCSTASYFSSVGVTLPLARQTGNLTLQPNSLVHSVIYDAEKGRAAGVRVIDRETGDLREVHARIVFLCASTLGSTQILLNSKPNAFPDGLANSSGALGHYLMDHHFQVGANGALPGLTDRYYVGNRPNGTIVPRFRNLGGPDSDGLGFSRGYYTMLWGFRTDWGRGAGEEGFGEALKEKLHDAGPWRVNALAFGECLPRYENYVELADETDAHGLPQLRIHCTWGENEFAMREDMQATAAEMLEAAGCEDVQPYDNYAEGALGAEPGLGIHEMGTARMGRDPETSVLGEWNEAHDVKGLFVTDGACMTSSACQNPSITYMALTARAADYAVKQMQRGHL